MKNSIKNPFRVIAVLLLTIGLVSESMADVELGPFKFRGYLRHYLSFNLEDVPETAGVDDKMDVSMNRFAFQLDTNVDTGPLSWTGRFRLTEEISTDYEDRLQATTNFLRGILAAGDGTTDFYDDEYDEVDIRELFFDAAVGDRVNVRIGRQQVVWGETDFFHATDVIHGFDLRWRNFYVPENEDVRKPLILLNGEIDVPELGGGLQLIVRPGLDDSSWIGNSIPTFGGRWSNNGSSGFPLASANTGGVGSFNYHHDEGDTDDAHYGMRWTGRLGKNEDVDYSLMYYHGQGGFQQDPILIFNVAAGELQFIVPETDTVGGSISGYIPFLDITYRAEMAYTPDRSFGTIPGALVQNDAYNFLLGFDANPRLQKWLKTSSPSLFTVQVFDWFLPGVNESDLVAHFTGAGAYDEHNVMMTSILTLPWLRDTLVGTVVGIADLTQGGGWIIPSLEYQYGSHLRFKVEADMAFGGNPITNPGAPNGSIVGAFDNSNQLLFRTTYQF